MNFLEAQRILKAFEGGEPLQFLVAMSGTSTALDTFVRATAAAEGRAAQVSTLPFNTLTQWSFSPAHAAVREVVLLFPWDLLPALDWRSGIADRMSPLREALEEADALLARLRSRPNSGMIYCAAPVPPAYPHPEADRELAAALRGLAYGSGARVLGEEVFGLGTYLSTGNPFAGAAMGTVARQIVDVALSRQASGAKVLVTDLDNVMWHGVIGEDGLEGIACAPEGPGYRYFIYQTMLAKLQREGVLIAAVSRNDEALARAPFAAGRTTLREDQLVCIVASYHAKSSQIAEIAERLNLGLESFVFVDDNPIELAEVGTRLPALRTIAFPSRDHDLPAFLGELSALFARTSVLDEDRHRTELYRRRVEGIAPSSVQGADLVEFLRGLSMRLTITDRSTGDRARAVQLINKTNQFNLNGRRCSDAEVGAILGGGGRLLCASLEDRSGSHGEILACLIGVDGTVESLVMSCRVFQRRVEHAFFSWLATQPYCPSSLEYRATERNEPIRLFLEHRAFAEGDGTVRGFDPETFREDFESSLELFELTVQRGAASAG